MTEAIYNRDIVLVWMEPEKEPTDKDFAEGEGFHRLGNCIVGAREHQPTRSDGKVPWIRWEKSVVFSPSDILNAYPHVKDKSDG